ncbi:MAG: hypothetical protein RL662_90 [Bacteroidota bacterium]|jgi:hypothetical protein
MNKKISSLSLALLLSLLAITNTSAQCKIENKYFQAGEYLTYDLYIKFAATVKGGVATLATQSVKYGGQDAYRMTLVSASQGFARKMFALNDTLSCYMSKDLIPLAYTKNAHEGDDHTIEKLAYSYTGDNVKIRTIRHKNGTFRFDETLSFTGCTYDLMSILFYARTLDYTSMTKGSDKRVNFVTGRSKVSMRIVYNGKEKMKANDGKKYNCMALTLYVQDEAFQNGKESMKVFITDDDNRLPVCVETKLKVGSTRVVLKSFRGNKHPLNVAQ